MAGTGFDAKYNHFGYQRKQLIQNLKGKRGDSDKCVTYWNLAYPSCKAEIREILRHNRLWREAILPVPAGDLLSIVMSDCVRVGNIELLLKVMLAVCYEMQRIHQAGVAHGNITGSNVKVDYSNLEKIRVTFVNFDLAQHASIDSCKLDLENLASLFAGETVYNALAPLGYLNKVIFPISIVPLQCSLVVLVAALHLELALILRDKNKNKEALIYLDNIMVSNPAVLQHDYYLQLYFMVLMPALRADDEKSEKMPLKHLKDQIELYSSDYKGWYKKLRGNVSQVIEDLNAIYEFAIKAKLEHIPVSAIRFVLTASDQRKSYRRSGNHKTNRLGFFNNLLDQKDAKVDIAQLSGTEKVIYHLAKFPKL